MPHSHSSSPRLAAPGILVATCLAVAVPNALANSHSYAGPDPMGWWNTLNGAQMVAALHGEAATEEQVAAAQKMYADLDSATQALVDAAAAEIYGDGGHDSAGAWWETLDCRKMRIAAGDGNTADPSSPFCAHYPGSGAAKILGMDEIAHVNVVGMGLLGRTDPGIYPNPDVRAERWWNSLNGPQMVAALYGDSATPAQAEAAKMMYADLDYGTKGRVDVAAAAIYGAGGHDSVGAWWETLDCRKMRIAAGDGNTADPSSPFCAHYPGSGVAKILAAGPKGHVDHVGQALLGRDEPGDFPPDDAMAMRWWNSLNGPQMVAALYGGNATPEQAAAAMKMYEALDAHVQGYVNGAAAEIYGNGGFHSVGAWWESLDCRKMRIAAGDGNSADPSSPFCAHYPGSGVAKILKPTPKTHVDRVGVALLGHPHPGTYPPPRGASPLIYTSARCKDGLCHARVGEAVRFRDTTGETVYSRTWNLQEGPVSSETAVEHTWLAPGFYKVSLTTNKGQDQTTASVTVLIETNSSNGLCVATPGTRCLQDSRYAVSADWWSASGKAGIANVAHGGTNESSLFAFHSPDNWEILLKVLDGCAVNEAGWVYGASPSDLGHRVRVTDTLTGKYKVYRNEAGHPAQAIIDPWAFPGACDETTTASAATHRGARPGPAPGPISLPVNVEDALPQRAGVCMASSTMLCVHDDRYEVTAEWSDWSDGTERWREAGVAPTQSSESGLFYFFSPDNWELMVKVLDGCDENGHHWVFGAAATDVGFDLKVRDRHTNDVKRYTKRPGLPVPAITDVFAFPMAGCSP